MDSSKIKVAVVQATPVLFDLEATVNKICELIEEAQKGRAQLVLFPEAFIPCYPRGLSFGTVVGSRSKEGRDVWLKYWENALDIESDYTRQISGAIKTAGIHCCIGITEREETSGTLYCSLLFWGPDGKILGRHRKLKPTAAERIIWGEGDGSTLNVYNTDIGKIGGLVCWENYMPLARMALYQQKVEFYLAPTADQRPGWLSSMQHIALEGRCFVLSCNQFVRKEDYPEELKKELEDANEVLCTGGSVIISPLGEILAGPLHGEEGILFAELDKRDIIKAKMDFDVIGHYHRPDVFEFSYKGAKKIDKT